MMEYVKNLGKPEPEKKVRISVAVDRGFPSWIDQVIEKRVFADIATPYVELQLS